MTEGAVKTPNRPKLRIRRGKKVTEGIEVATVLADIKEGRLRPKDEFSLDGENWRRLDQHVQLAKMFAQAPKKPKSGNKGLKVFLFLMVVAALGALFVHPYVAFYNFQIAADTRNHEKLSQWMDPPALLQDFKVQMDGQWAIISAQKFKNSPYAQQAGALGRKKMDQWAGTLITPEAVVGYAGGKTGVISFPSGKSAGKDKPSSGNPPRDPIADFGPDLESVILLYHSFNDVLTRAELGYQNVSTFTATRKADTGESFVFRFERRGIDWKLAGVQLPAGPLGKSVDLIAGEALKDARNQANASNKNRKLRGEKQKQDQVAKLVNEKKAYMANLEIQSLTVGKGKKYQFGSPNPGVFATLTNKGKRTLKEVEITLYFYNKKGAIAREHKLYPVSVSKYRPGRDNDPLGPNKSKKVEYLVKSFAPPSWGGKVQMRVTDIALKE